MKHLPVHLQPVRVRHRVGHAELKDKDSPFPPFFELILWANNRSGQGQNEGHAASRAGISPAASPMSSSGFTPDLRLHHPSYHLPIQPTCSLKLLALLRSSLSPAPGLSSPVYYQHRPQLPVRLSLPIPSSPFQGTPSPTGKGRRWGMSKLVKAPPTLQGALSARPLPSNLDFGCQGGSRNRLFSGSSGSRHAQAPPSLFFSSPSLPPRLLLGSTPRFLEGSTPYERRDSFLQSFLQKLVSQNPLSILYLF